MTQTTDKATMAEDTAQGLKDAIRVDTAELRGHVDAVVVYADPATAPRPAARVLAHLQDLQSYEDSVHRPYIHLLDGGLSDNLGMRGAWKHWKTWKR
jgi:hypothetical protein